MAYFLPVIFYVLIIIMWGAVKYRFLVPVLPLLLIFASFGFLELITKKPLWRYIGWVCFLGTLLWNIVGFFLMPPFTRYYIYDAKHASDYAQMIQLVEKMNKLEPGVLIGYSNSLDGGIETLYWHNFPFVAGRGKNEQIIRKLAKDFDAKYIWADYTNKDRINSFFHNARIVISNEKYYLFKIQNYD